MSAPTTGLCSAICRELNEPLPGTAVTATGWVVLEQPGPWGAKAPTESRLDREFGAPDRCRMQESGPPVRPDPLPSPPPGPAARPACVHQRQARRVLRAARPADRRHLGRAAARPGLESNHLGGHRFAPTATMLPDGMMYGHLDPETAAAILPAADRGETVLTGLRGRSSWSKRGQAAEIAVRQLIGETGLDSLRVEAENLETVTVRHLDGRGWTVPVTSETAHPARPESCGKEPFAMSILHAGTPIAGGSR